MPPKVFKAKFGNSVEPKCKREMFKERTDIPICVKRLPVEIDTTFRPHNKPVVPNPPKPVPPEPQPVPPKPEPKPEPRPQGSRGVDTTDIIGAVVGTAIGAGALAKGLQTEPTTQAIDRALANTELGDEPVDLIEPSGTSTSFENISQQGLRNRFQPSEVEMTELEGETQPLLAEGGDIIPAFEETAIATAETTAEVGALADPATWVALPAILTVGALVDFAHDGLFDFQGQASSFQQGDYTPLEKPRPPYIPPAPMTTDPQATMAYLDEQNRLLTEYQNALDAYNKQQDQQQQP
jgi:hypothetical protein